MLDTFNVAFLQNIIYSDEYGYHLYDRYRIYKDDQQYKVERSSDGKILGFSKLRYAATWCILDRWNKIVEARRVIEINNVLESLFAEGLVHRKQQRSKNLEVQELGRDKYLVVLDKQKRFQYELDKYIKMAKNCQEKGYQNELTRVSRK